MPTAPSDASDVPSTLVVVLVPESETVDPSLAYYTDYSQSRHELTQAFAVLGRPWRWTPVTVSSYAAVLDALVRDSTARGEPLPTVLNLCDGDESNDVPGVAVIDALEAKGFQYTGANAAFYRGTTSKTPMKAAFRHAAVSTPPWHVWQAGDDAEVVLAAVGIPAIVKPAVSAGSMGVTTDSVVHTADGLLTQLAALEAGYLGWNLLSGGVLVERFVAGREFTVLIVGSAASAESAHAFLPVERVFNAALPHTEQFLSYDRLWEVYERESALPGGAYLWEYAAITGKLADDVMRLSWDAYVAVGGHGYGRIDIRQDKDSGALYVLEVNAQCALSEDENCTSVGAILRFAKTPYAALLARILAQTEARP